VDEFDGFLRQRALQLLAQGAHLGTGGLQGPVQARGLLLDPRGLQPLLGHLQRVREADPGPAQGQAAGSAMPGEGQPHPGVPLDGRGDACWRPGPRMAQASSSNRFSNRSTTACIASASSTPSVRTVTGVPWPAASSITPMMLLALTSRPFACRVTAQRKGASAWTSLAVA